MTLFNRLIRKFVGSAKTEQQLRRFYSDLPPTSGSAGKVLQYVGISSMYLTPMEVLLYHLLRQNGFDVDYFVYDESVPINEVITLERETTQGKDKFWKKSFANGDRMLKAGRVPYQSIPMSDEAKSIAQSLPDLDAVLDFQFEEIDFGDIIRDALYRYYKSLTFGEYAENVAKRMLVTALSNYMCVKDLCEKNNYRYVMFSHGIYITWQPVVEYCRRNNIDYVCYDRAKTKNYGNFNVNQPSPDWSFDRAWERYSDRQLTASEKECVTKYLGERELQKGDNYAYNFSARANDVAKEKQRLGIPPDRKCITIFTNLIWDAANVSRDIAFPSALQCVISMIEHYRNDLDKQIIVRSHPAEKIIGTSERYSTLVQEHFGNNLPENVTLVSPEDDVNSFTVIDMTDVGVVNTSTVGLEMAVLGKPVVLISETHYRDKGFTFDVNDETEFFSAIETALDQRTIDRNQLQLAEKYFYMMMFLYQQRLPSVYENGLFQRYCCEDFNALSSDEPLAQIVTKMVRGRPDDFVEWPVSTSG